MSNLKILVVKLTKIIKAIYSYVFYKISLYGVFCLCKLDIKTGARLRSGLFYNVAVFFTLR